MIGLLTVAKKAMTIGYRRYGLKGAIALGVLTLVGYVLLRRALDAAAESDRLNSAVDAERIRDAVEEEGVGAMADPEIVGEAIDPEGVGDTVAMDDPEAGDAADSREGSNSSA